MQKMMHKCSVGFQFPKFASMWTHKKRMKIRLSLDSRYHNEYKCLTIVNDFLCKSQIVSFFRKTHFMGLFVRRWIPSIHVCVHEEEPVGVMCGGKSFILYLVCLCVCETLSCNLSVQRQKKSKNFEFFFFFLHMTKMNETNLLIWTFGQVVSDLYKFQ